jgi:hypothetical protein
MRTKHQPQSPTREVRAPGASGDAFLIQGVQMARSEDDSPNPLPEELDRALRRATDRTLVALTSLRKAVRQHVHDERERGSSLPNIERELREIIARALKDAEVREPVNGERDTLSNQMIKWSHGFYEESN